MSIKSEQTLLPTRFGAKSLSDTIAVFFDMDHPTRGNDDPNMNGAPHDAEQNAVSWLLQSLRDWFPMSQPLIHQMSKQIAILTRSICNSLIEGNGSAKLFIDDKTKEAIAIKSASISPTLFEGEADILRDPSREVLHQNAGRLEWDLDAGLGGGVPAGDRLAEMLSRLPTEDRHLRRRRADDLPVRPEQGRHERRLADALAVVDAEYDLVLIDCPPSLSMLTLNGLCAAHGVIVPMQCEYFALEGLTDLVNTIKQVHANLNKELKIIALLRVMFDPRITLQMQVSDQLKAHFGDKVFDTVIPRNVRLAEAPSYGLPGVVFDTSAKGSQAYLEFASELVRRAPTL